jgi:hypothetical protein
MQASHQWLGNIVFNVEDQQSGDEQDDDEDDVDDEGKNDHETPEKFSDSSQCAHNN